LYSKEVIEMEWKRFGSGRIGSSSKASKLIRLIRGLKDDCASVSPSGLENKNHQQPIFNVQAFIVEKQRAHEIETEKAMLTSVARHQRWNTGGPA